MQPLLSPTLLGIRLGLEIPRGPVTRKLVTHRGPSRKPICTAVYPNKKGLMALGSLHVLQELSKGMLTMGIAVRYCLPCTFLH